MSSFRLGSLNIVLLFVTVAALMFGAYGFIMQGKETARPGDSAGTDALNEFGGGDASDPIAGTERTKKKRPDGKPERDPSGRIKPVSPTGGDDPTTKYETPLPDSTIESSPSDRGDATIEGTVIDSANAPVSGATVTARRSDLELEPPALEGDDLARYGDEVVDFLATAARETRTTISAQDGRFSFRDLDASLAYDLAARTDSAAGDQDRVAAGDDVVILLSAQSALIGTVQTKDGKPITQFSVRAWRQNRQWEAVSRGFDDEQGRFSLPAKSGTMQVEVTAPGFTQDKPQDVEVGVAAVIVLNQAAILTGIVSDKEGNALGDVVVRQGGADENRQRGWNQQDNGPTARTDSKGRYRFDTLTPKETKLTASLGEMSETQTTTLAQGENTLDFKLDVGAIVRLRVSDPEGKPVDTDSAWFQEKSNQGWHTGERMPAREPGLAEYAGLKPGEYTMRVSAASYPTISQDVTIMAGLNELTLKFTKGCMLAGTITSSGGGKVANVGVRLRKETEERWGGWGNGRYSQVGEDGTYKLGPAEPGQWLVEVYATNTWNEVYSGIVTIAEGENSHNIVVDSGATVTIKLTDEQGNAVAWGNAQLQGEKSYNAQSNGEGLATISFVTVGSYAVIATANGLASPSQFLALVSGDNQVTLKLQKPNCCRITHVYPDTQAAKLGLQIGDLIIEYNGTAVTSWGGFGQAVKAAQQATEITVNVERGGSLLTFTLKGGYVGIEGTDGVR